MQSKTEQLNTDNHTKSTLSIPNGNKYNKLQSKQSWLDIPMDYTSTSLTDFQSLMRKQKKILPITNNGKNGYSSRLIKFMSLNENKNNKNKMNNDEKEEEEKKQSESETLSKKYWISDRNCNKCSECGITFNIINRKHHCRLCGKIFCHICCSQKIEININNNNNNKNEKELMEKVCLFCSKLNATDQLLGIDCIYPKKIKINKKICNDKITNKWYDEHIKFIISQLCKFENINNIKQWEELMYSYSNKINNRIVPNITDNYNEYNDIRYYVKIKNIENGKISDCKLINGVIFEKNISHRNMRSNIVNPKILLLNTSIDYKRHHTNLTSFDILLSQQNEYINIIIDKISSLKPDIVITSQTINRLIIKLLLKKNITLITNIDTNIMERIAKSINAPILNSIDHLNQFNADNNILGECGKFYIKYYNLKKRRVPLMFFDECRLNTCNHITVLLRGDNKANLVKIKSIFRMAIHSMYHINLEKSYLSDTNSTMMNILNNNDDNQQLENVKHSFLSTSPFIKHNGWKRELIIKNIIKSKQEIKGSNKCLYDHNNFGEDINDIQGSLKRWDPLLPNTDNRYLCQTLIINHCRVLRINDTEYSQCISPKLKVIDFYTKLLDVSLGQYLNKLFKGDQCPNSECNEHLTKHILTYSHNDKQIVIKLKLNDNLKENENDEPILMWTQCKICKINTSKPKPMSYRTFCLSFGKFLEMLFYSYPAIPMETECKHIMSDHHIFNFSLNNMIICINSVPNESYKLMALQNIGINNLNLQYKYYVNELNILELVCKYTFAAFLTKIDELINMMSGCSNIIINDLYDIRKDVKTECKEVMTQFLNRRNKLHTKCLKEKDNEHLGTISFLNKQRYHLYHISLEWNELLDGLHVFYVNGPNKINDIDPNKYSDENTNIWEEKLELKTFTDDDDDNDDNDDDDDDDDEYHSALKEVDNINNIKEVDVDIDFKWIFDESPNKSIAELFPDFNKPLTTKNITLNDVNINRLKQEPLFLIASNTNLSNNIGDNAYYPHFNILPPKSLCNDEIIPIYINEPSSIIAYTLSSLQYHCKINNIRYNNNENTEELHKKINDNKLNQRKEIKYKYKINNNDKQIVEEKLDLNDLKIVNNDNNINILKFEFIDGGYQNIVDVDPISTTFQCNIYYSVQFNALRKRLYGIDIEINFIESLSRCKQIEISGGKKGTFCKTLDDRFLLKFIKSEEFTMFLANIESYFEYMTDIIYSNYSSLLVPIIGCYEINWIKSNKKKLNLGTTVQYVLIMPNLFYSQNMYKLKLFDLKGTLNTKRYIDTNNTVHDENDDVKLDKNFINEYMNGLPLPLNECSANYLNSAIYNDTKFVSSSNIMDYSLLMAINEEKNEIICGIIDYLETYSWKKKAEQTAKKIIEDDSTIQNPQIYKQRFREYMKKYFMFQPNRKTQRSLIKNVNHILLF